MTAFGYVLPDDLVLDLPVELARLDVAAVADP
jgi:hypothetical protein